MLLIVIPKPVSHPVLLNMNNSRAAICFEWGGGKDETARVDHWAPPTLFECIKPAGLVYRG